MGDMMTGFGWGLAAAANQGISVVINTDPDVFLHVVERKRWARRHVPIGSPAHEVLLSNELRRLDFLLCIHRATHSPPNVELLAAESIQAPGN
jgi:hypothetical protein